MLDTFVFVLKSDVLFSEHALIDYCKDNGIFEELKETSTREGYDGLALFLHECLSSEYEDVAVLWYRAPVSLDTSAMDCKHLSEDGLFFFVEEWGNVSA